MKNILYPTLKENVMDLLKKAGMDVSDWANYRGKHPASNPRYCYEWSFVESGKRVVLNLWYEDIIEVNGLLLCKLNLKSDADYYIAEFKKSVWAKRASKMDEALRIAKRENLEVRVIICNGKIKRKNKEKPEASIVENRMLDPIPWTITEYDFATGHCILERGIKEVKSKDQFDLNEVDEPKMPKKSNISSSAYDRDPLVRKKVLARANNRCEYCGEIGFITNSGYYYLETHHIIPLSEKGYDNELNVIAICPLHHRIAHYGKDKKLLLTEFKEKIKELYG